MVKMGFYLFISEFKFSVSLRPDQSCSKDELLCVIVSSAEIRTFKPLWGFITERSNGDLVFVLPEHSLSLVQMRVWCLYVVLSSKNCLFSLSLPSLSFLVVMVIILNPKCE